MIDKAVILYHYLHNKLRRRFTDRKQLKKWQERQVLKHVNYVRQYSPFYADLWQEFDDKDWRKFPMIDKSMMMNSFDTFNTLGITKEEAFSVAERAEKMRDFSPMIGSTVVGLSSGTSGNRGIFLISNDERRAWTGTILAKVLPQSIFKREKIAFFLRANSNLYGSVKSRQIQFEFYDLLHSIEKHIQRLNIQKPGILVSPPSMLRILAEEKQANRLLIEPHTIISVAEVLDPVDEQVIQEVFNKQVHQIYQCTEGFLGHTCEYGTIHLNEDVVIVQKEYIHKEQGMFIPIITDFRRKTQPIVRYRLNDLLQEKQEPCACGSPFIALEKIDGRADDIFYFHHVINDSLTPVFPDFIRRAILLASHNITEYYAIQQAPDELLIHYRMKGEPSARINVENSIMKNIGDLCHTLSCQLPHITFRMIEKGMSRLYDGTLHIHEIRKLRRIERRYDLHAFKN